MHGEHPMLMKPGHFNRIAEVLPYGVLKLEDPLRGTFWVNGHRTINYFGDVFNKEFNGELDLHEEEIT